MIINSIAKAQLGNHRHGPNLSDCENKQTLSPSRATENALHSSIKGFYLLLLFGGFYNPFFVLLIFERKQSCKMVAHYFSLPRKKSRQSDLACLYRSNAKIAAKCVRARLVFLIPLEAYLASLHIIYFCVCVLVL